VFKEVERVSDEEKCIIKKVLSKSLWTLESSCFSSQDENKAKDKKGKLIFVAVHATWLQIIQELVWTFLSSLQGSILHTAF